MNKKLWIYTLLLLVFSCYDDPVADLRECDPAEGTLTVEAACELYREYMSRRPVSRSLDEGGRTAPLNPGMITAHWESATVSANGVNSYVAVPFHASRAYYAKSTRNSGYVSVLQKVVVVQEDSSLRNDVYVMSLIPEGEFARKPKYELAVMSEGGTVPKDYTGLLLYTLPDGGLPVYTARLESGRVVEDVYIFDKSRPVEENIALQNEMLADYSLRSYPIASPNSLPEYSGGTDPGSNPETDSGDDKDPGGDDWAFEPDGDSFTNEDGDECWYYTDPDGDRYVLIDMDGDGEPDHVLLPDVNPGGGVNPGEGGIEIGGEIGGGHDSEEKPSPEMSDMVKALFKNNGLGSDIEEFNKLLEGLVGNDCAYKALYNYLKDKDKFDVVVYDPGLEEKGAEAAANSKKLKFKNQDCMTLEALREELFHMYQYRYLGLDDITPWRNMVEYEYALFADINRFVRYGGNVDEAMKEDYWFCCEVANMEYKDSYEKFLKDITSNGTRYGYRPITRKEFYEWAAIYGKMNRTYNINRGYDYTIDYTMTINNLLELAKNNCGK